MKSVNQTDKYQETDQQFEKNCMSNQINYTAANSISIFLDS